MRTIDSIIIHCSATICNKDFTAADIDRWHRHRSFNGIGYHFVIRLDGTIENGRAIEKPGAHCVGWNNRSIGICYIGGLDACGHPADTRTPKQKEAMKTLINRLQHEYFGIRSILGHRDTSPDLNGDGRIEPNEFIKACPCFDVRTWLRSVSLTGLCLGFCLCTASCGSYKSSSSSTEKADVSIISQTAQETQQKKDVHLSQKQASDSSALHQSSTEEYMEQTTIIRRKRQNASTVEKNCNEEKTDTLMMNTGKSKEKTDVTYQIVRQQKKSEKQKKTGYATLWLIGGGCASALLLFRQVRQIRKNKPRQC